MDSQGTGPVLALARAHAVRHTFALQVGTVSGYTGRASMGKICQHAAKMGEMRRYTAKDKTLTSGP